MRDSVTPHDPQPSRTIYQGDLVEVGLFRCHPTYPHFEDAGAITSHLLVFPRTSVRITHAGREPVVANPNVVMYYNAGQVYRREKLSEWGDRCEWFAFDARVVLDALRPYDSRVEDHPERPFVFTHGPSDPTGYLLQRRVVEHILATPQPDRLFVEETMIGVLSRAIENTCNRHRPGRQADRAHRELVRVVQTLLVTRFHEHLTIERIADAVHYSPYHLCRVFRQHTGMTIHQYLNQVRLRTALEMIADGGADLTEVALDLCYSSHSHFTQAFRRAFGVPPSRMKAIPVAQNLRQMSKISIA